MNKRRRLNLRISSFYTLLIILVFLGIFVGFNLLSQQYIQDGIHSQLLQLQDSIKGKPNPSTDIQNLPKHNDHRFGLEANVFIIDEDYHVKVTSNNNQDVANTLAAYLKDAAIDLDDVDDANITIQSKQFTLSFLEDGQRDDSYFVFYVDSTGINEFVVTINYTLAIILVIAIVIVFLATTIFTKSITNPVKQLTLFANRIGQTDFTQENFDFKDIEFQQLGQKMNETATKLDLYDKDQKTFFQNVSHELRTPLQTIKSYAEGIQFKLMDPTTSSQTIITETDKLSDMVEDLLYISRLDSLGFHSMPIQHQDLRETLEFSVASLSSLASKRNLKFNYQFDENPVMMTCNEKHFERAFMNLLSNAIRYAKTEINLACHKHQDRIEISISDDGEGIDLADKDHLFDRFYKGKHGKHGIGLSIVQSVVKFYQGEILVSNENGAKFTLTFPLKKLKPE